MELYDKLSAKVEPQYDEWTVYLAVNVDEPAMLNLTEALFSLLLSGNII